MVGMTPWILVGVYLLGYVVFWRWMVWQIAAEGDASYRYPPDGEALFIGVLCGSLFNLLWPVIQSGRLINRVYQWRGENVAFAFAPRSIRRQLDLQRREQELAERERRIEALELSTGIKPGNGGT
jgi:hypothetical protein